MRHPPRTAIAAALSAFAATAVGQGFTPSVPPEQRNAALRYWAAWAQISPELTEKTGAIDWNALGTTADPADLPEAFSAAAAAVEPVANQLLLASRLEKCDFELPYEQGWGMLLPHLSKMREGARVLRVDARAKLAAGDADGAAERVAAMYRVARHTAGDDVMISSLVSAAVGAFADAEVDALLASGRLTVPARDALRGALTGPDEADPFRMRRAVENEKKFIVGWIRANFTGPDAGEKLFRYMRVEMGAAEATVAPSVRKMDGSALAREADQVARYYDETLAAWGGPGAVAALEGLDARVRDGGFGPVVQLLGAAVRKAYESDLKGRTARARVIEALNKAPVR